MFEKGIPVWAEGLREEMNVTLGFYAAFTRQPGKQYTVSAATCGFYRLFVNGRFAFAGPLRTARGYFRTDRVELDPFLTEGVNHVALEVTNAFINAYSTLRQPGFVCAEIREDDRVLAATGPAGDFSAFLLPERVRKIQRYSYQRTFSESYRLRPGVFAWRTGDFAGATPVNLVSADERNFLPRTLPLHTFPKVTPAAMTSRGKTKFGVKPAAYRKDRSLANIGPLILGFPENELEEVLSNEVQEFAFTPESGEGPYEGETVLKNGEYEVLSFDTEKSGFVGLQIECLEAGTLYLLFDEILTDGVPDPLRMQCTNVLKFRCEAGTYDFLSFEPYEFKYLQAVAAGGRFAVRDLHIRELVSPLPLRAVYTGDNPALARIFDAAKETFRQNAPDLFTDCPSRERAGWLCDSFFAARAERVFTGENRTEKHFLENYLLPESFENLPRGMLPMCYPAEHFNEKFIPNWAMWFVLELRDYEKRTGDREFVAAFRKRVRDLLAYFEKFENEFGLLENLESWIFVEWSRANRLVRDVNYPTCMLYSATLKAAGEMYGDEALIRKGEAVAEAVRRQAFDGQFFVDNAVRENGVLRSPGERTETCQYYAFFFDVATPETYPDLWRKLVEDFGPERAKKGLYPDIHPYNAFIGLYLRLDLLSRHGLHDRCLREVEAFFGPMAEKTGTLWENLDDSASCNHGFAAYVVCLMQNAGLVRTEPTA